MLFWNRWYSLCLFRVVKYTHFPEAEDPTHHVNHHWFVYRREAALTLQQEVKCAGKIATRLLFGEVYIYDLIKAKRNVLTKRYVCNPDQASTLAGLQLQMAYGDYDEERCPRGFLSYIL